jgi:hypothetical protein
VPRTCTVCGHEDRHEIDAALVAREPFRRIAARYRISASSLRRHEAAGHVAAAVVACAEARDRVQGADLFAQAEELHARALSLLAKAETAGDLRTAVTAIHAARGCLELNAKMRSTVAALSLAVVPDEPSEAQATWAAAVLDRVILRLEA